MTAILLALAATISTCVLGFLFGARYATAMMRKMISETHEAMDAAEQAVAEQTMDPAREFWHDAPGVIDLEAPPAIRSNVDEILRDTARAAAERRLLEDVARAVEERQVCESCMTQRATHVVLWPRGTDHEAGHFLTCAPCASMVHSGARVEPL